MKKIWACYASVIYTLVLSFAVSAIAQTLPPPPPIIEEDEGIIKVESRLVIVPVSVTDGNGNPVKGLEKENFRIRENSRNQEIAEVSDAEKAPLEIALLFDVSASTDTMFKFEQETAAKFLADVMRPEDRATIFTIGEFPLLVQHRNIAYRSIKTIRGIKPTKQRTAFYDTVMEAANYLDKNAPPKTRKVIIAITDGEDSNSQGVKTGMFKFDMSLNRRKKKLGVKKLRQARLRNRNAIRTREQSITLKRLQDADAVFYSVNPAGSSYKLNKISKFGQDNMQRFADETGGTAFLPKFLPIDLKSNYNNSANLKKNTQTLERIFKQLTNELQAQYLVQYYSDGEYPIGKFIKVGVKTTLNLPQGVRIRSRQGYFVKKQQSNEQK